MLGLYTTEAYKAGELGFEPRQYESESQVLPLHHSPSACQLAAGFRSTAKFIIPQTGLLVNNFFEKISKEFLPVSAASAFRLYVTTAGVTFVYQVVLRTAE